MAKKILDYAALILVIIGGINWSLFGLFNVDLVDLLLRPTPILTKIAYILIGLAALYLIYFTVKE